MNTRKSRICLKITVNLIGKYGIYFKRVEGMSARLVWRPYFRKF